jgi:hypothetical protein
MLGTLGTRVPKYFGRSLEAPDFGSYVGITKRNGGFGVGSLRHSEQFRIIGGPR